MTFKEYLCNLVVEMKEDQNMTYKDLMSFGVLHKSQVYAILKNNGEGVSLDKILDFMGELGFGFAFCAEYKPENQYLKGGGYEKWTMMQTFSDVE